MCIASYAFLVAERVVGVIHQLHLAPTFLAQSIIKLSFGDGRAGDRADLPVRLTDGIAVRQ